MGKDATETAGKGGEVAMGSRGDLQSVEGVKCMKVKEMVTSLP